MVTVVNVSTMLSHISASLESQEMQAAVRAITVELEPDALRRLLAMYGRQMGEPGMTIPCGSVMVSVLARPEGDP